MSAQTEDEITMGWWVLVQAGQEVLEGSLCWGGSKHLLLPVGLVVPLWQWGDKKTPVIPCSTNRNRISLGNHSPVLPS